MYCVGNVEEWAKQIIPQKLTPELGREWPMTAGATFRWAMELTRAERQKLSRTRSGKRRRLADIDERLRPDTDAQADADAHEKLDDGVDENQPLA